MVKMCKVYSIDLLKKKLTVTVGKYASLADGSCMVRYGDTVVNVAVSVSSKPKDGVDFFPLSVDYDEKFYACGRIPESFPRREGKPSEKAILTSRLIDRSIRPLFPSNLRNEVSIVCTVMSMDPDSSPEVTSIIGASIALSISSIPWDGPVSAVNVGLMDGKKIVFNPTTKESKLSSMLTTVVSTSGLVTMLESSAKEVSNDVMLNAIKKGHEFNSKVIDFIEKIKKEVGKKKFACYSNRFSENMLKAVTEYIKKDLKSALTIKDKDVKEQKLNDIYEKVKEKFADVYPEEIDSLDDYLYLIKKEIVRNWILRYKKRLDGRKLDELRSLSAEVGILPRVHGSAVFSRGYTQVLSAVTLGSFKDRLLVDNLYGEYEKRYFHHYNFPSYSVGETKPLRAPGRREIGHGALAEKALVPVIPKEEDFPYTIRVVSEVLSSNGSTSQGSVCGSTLALMDAGVPITAPVAGISCGLVFKDEKNWKTMVDIQGIEDFFGDMDFKVAGTEKGITAIQVDTKIIGLTFDIIKEALDKTYKARLKILNDVMLKVIKKPRRELSKYAPKLLVFKIGEDKIKDVIGPGGKVVQRISTDYDCKIDISDDGKVFIEGKSSEKCNEASKTIENIAKDFKVGEVYDCTVTKVVKFGVFVEIVPGREGFCHISNLDSKRIDNIDSFVKIKDKLLLKVIEVDNQGKIILSRKDALGM